jgi:hypothetical protein
MRIHILTDRQTDRQTDRKPEIGRYCSIFGLALNCTKASVNVGSQWVKVCKCYLISGLLASERTL